MFCYKLQNEKLCCHTRRQQMHNIGMHPIRYAATQGDNRCIIRHAPDPYQFITQGDKVMVTKLCCHTRRQQMHNNGMHPIQFLSCFVYSVSKFISFSQKVIIFLIHLPFRHVKYILSEPESPRPIPYPWTFSNSILFPSAFPPKVEICSQNCSNILKTES